MNPKAPSQATSDRRQFNARSASWLALLIASAGQQASALTLADLSNTDATKGLSTIGILGAENGSLGNDRVRINLPGALNDTANLLRRFRQDGQVDELVTAMNRGAEAAVPQAKNLLSNAVHERFAFGALK